MDLNEFWGSFRKTWYFRILVLALVSVLAVLLFQIPGSIACLSLILIPLMWFLIPYWFGEKGVKNHAVNGVILLLLTTLFYAAMAAPAVTGATQVAQSGNLDLNGNPARAVLTGGAVTPFRGGPGTAFTFNVTMTSSDPSAHTWFVVTQLASFPGVSDIRTFYVMYPKNPANYSSGVAFNVTVPRLSAEVHQFNFLVVTNNVTAPQAGDVITQSTGSWGPFVADFWAHFAFFLIHGVLEFVILVFGFYLILLIFWWTRKAREIRGAQPPKPEAKRAEGGGEFTCTNCGADVSESDTKCPKCGAEFEAEGKGGAEEKGEPAGPKA